MSNSRFLSSGDDRVGREQEDVAAVLAHHVAQTAPADRVGSRRRQLDAPALVGAGRGERQRVRLAVVEVHVVRVVPGVGVRRVEVVLRPEGEEVPVAGHVGAAVGAGDRRGVEVRHGGDEADPVAGVPDVEVVLAVDGRGPGRPGVSREHALGAEVDGLEIVRHARDPAQVGRAGVDGRVRPHRDARDVAAVDVDRVEVLGVVRVVVGQLLRAGQENRRAVLGRARERDLGGVVAERVGVDAVALGHRQLARGRALPDVDALGLAAALGREEDPRRVIRHRVPAALPADTAEAVFADLRAAVEPLRRCRVDADVADLVAVELHRDVVDASVPVKARVERSGVA